MARFVTVEVGCDWPDCGTRAAEGDDTIVAKQLSIDGKQAREFLLCVPKHLDAFEDVVLPLMQAGVKVETAPSRPRSRPVPVPAVPDDPDVIICQVCDRPIRKRIGMAQHVRKTHGYPSLESYEAEHGPVS